VPVEPVVRPDGARTRHHFGALLRHWRQARELTQRQLGERLGYDHTHISKLESGQRRPPPGFAERCDAVLDTGGALTALTVESRPGGTDAGGSRRRLAPV
jgi:transcriptional regulator with XRE-family HTH domain